MTATIIAATCFLVFWLGSAVGAIVGFALGADDTIGFDERQYDYHSDYDFMIGL